ncbi:hypothetical protein TNCV_929052 [Trichonephila clavipes]|nr:hypothetical protein TNCV_929052 [Trichonephila clavipes]
MISTISNLQRISCSVSFREAELSPFYTGTSELKTDSLVYADKPQTLDHLEDNIRRVIADIRPQMLEKVIENWTSRLDYIRASRCSPMPEIIFKIKKSERKPSLADVASGWRSVKERAPHLTKETPSRVILNADSSVKEDAHKNTSKSVETTHRTLIRSFQGGGKKGLFAVVERRWIRKMVSRSQTLNEKIIMRGMSSRDLWRVVLEKGNKSHVARTRTWVSRFRSSVIRTHFIGFN